MCFGKIEFFGSCESLHSDSSRNESPSDRDINLIYSSSGSIKSDMALSTSNQSSFYEYAMKINFIYLEDNWIQAFLLDWELSNTWNEVGVILYEEGTFTRALRMNFSRMILYEEGAFTTKYLTFMALTFLLTPNFVNIEIYP